ncbi:unnamed protein product [Lymnaea stagnalis]|uniref:Uncharacterized protein n=1 Tax=Lymnaea stagnalis TaxID=6523 RepID=A0AAV2IFP2_LYMST
MNKFIYLLLVTDCLYPGQITEHMDFKESACETECNNGFLVSTDTCIYSCLVNLNYGYPKDAYVSILVQSKVKTSAEEIFSLEPFSDCRRYKKNSINKCAEIEANIFNISVLINAKLDYNAAEITCKMHIPGQEQSYRKVLNFPKIIDSKNGTGKLKINGYLLNENHIISINGSNLTVEFDCSSEASPCVIEILTNDSYPLIRSSNSIKYIMNINAGKYLHLMVKYAACKLEEQYNTINCTILPILGQGRKVMQTDENLYLYYIIIPISILLILGLITSGYYILRKFKAQDKTIIEDERKEYIELLRRENSTVPSSVVYEIEKSTNDPQQLYNSCTKTPGHTQFISCELFSHKDIPDDYGGQDMFDLITNMAGLTVHLKVEEQKFTNGKSEDVIKYGTGFVESIVKYSLNDGVPCQCKKCEINLNKSKEWRSIVVYTSIGVVSCESEAQNTTCRFFYDSKDSGIVAIKGFEQERQGYKCKLKFETCEKDKFHIFDELLQKGNEWSHLCRYFNEKYEDRKKEKKLTIIVSHIHGLHKMISTGEWTNREVKSFDGNEFTKYSYTTSTCPGSAGSYVFIIGRDHTGVIHHHIHRGVDSKGMNSCEFAKDWCS